MTAVEVRNLVGFDGTVYLAATDLAKAMAARATDCREKSAACDDEAESLAWRSVAHALEKQVQELELFGIEIATAVGDVVGDSR